MLYLAEVQKKTRVLGSSKAEFKLLACQRSEQSWSAVPGEETISAPDDVPYNAGALVMVEVSANKQVQRHSDAGRQLVSILQNFSRLQEKAKTQEEEIEQWKQSLTYQSQELNRREMEMEARQEQLQQMEEDFERLDQQRREFEATQEQVNKLREEYERNKQELEGAWAHLQGEMNRFDERKSEFQQSVGLDEAKAQEIQELLNRLSGAVAPTESVREQLNLSFEVIDYQQGTFNGYWQTIEQQRATAQQMQEEIDRQEQELHHQWEDWHRSQSELEQDQADLKAKQQTVALREANLQRVTETLQAQESLQNQILGLIGPVGSSAGGAKVDREALERISLDELQSIAQELERELQKLSSFVNSQEEELTLQKQAIEALEAQIQNANEYDRLRLETELADERESYEMLNETLVGQRRNLQERESVLRQHQAILARRQGIAPQESEEQAIDLSPLISQIETLKQQYSDEINHLQAEIQQITSQSDQTQASLQERMNGLDARRQEIKQFEEHVKTQRASVAEIWGKVAAYQELLQPSQDSINGLKANLETIGNLMAQFQEASDYQLQAIAEMRQLITALTNNPAAEFVAS